MKIAITGVTGFKNRGVEALVRPLVEGLLLRRPDAEIFIASWTPQYDAQRLNNLNAKFVKDCYQESGGWVPVPAVGHSLFSWFKRQLRRVRDRISRNFGTNKEQTILMPFPTVDLLIVSGGDLFGSDYGSGDLAHHLKPLVWAKKNNIPSILIGQSVGPFTSSTDAKKFVEATDRVNYITTREPLSYRYLTANLGFSSEKVKLCADMAFLLEACTKSHKQMRLCNSRPVVALSISQSITKWTGCDYEEHLNSWIILIDRMLKTWNVTIVLIPHVQEPYSDDREILTLIYRKFEFDTNVNLFAGDLTASEFKGLIQASSLVIAERMHAAIAGLSSGICTVPITYSVKAEGIMRSVLEGSPIESNELCISLKELLNIEASWRKLDEIWTNRTKYKSAISNSLERSKALARQNIDFCLSIN